MKIGKLIIEFPEYIYDIVNCIKFLVIAFIVYFLCVTCVIPIIKEIISALSKLIRKQKFKFNDFEDYNQVKQNESEREQLENEWEFIEESYSQKYNKKKVKNKMKSIKLIDTFEASENEIKDGISVKKLLEENNDFDMNLFKKWGSNLFEYIQLGNVEEIKLIKNSMSEVLFDKKIIQLQNFERDNIDLKRDDLLIEDVKLIDYSSGSGKSLIKMYIKTRLKEYIINKKNNRVIRGNKRVLTDRNYILTFQKINSDEVEGFIGNCSKCGGLVSENEFCRCTYCGNLVNPIRYNWILVKMELL